MTGEAFQILLPTADRYTEVTCRWQNNPLGLRRSPQPAVGRDPALGGMGRHLVTELTARRGWAVTAGRKHVRASLPAA